jgi:hypothetical protein
MFAFGAFLVPARVEHNDHEDHEAQTQEHDHPGPIFPDLLNAIRKLGPIHASARYTASGEK